MGLGASRCRGRAVRRYATPFTTLCSPLPRAGAGGLAARRTLVSPYTSVGATATASKGCVCPCGHARRCSGPGGTYLPRLRGSQPGAFCELEWPCCTRLPCGRTMGSKSGAGPPLGSRFLPRATQAAAGGSHTAAAAISTLAHHTSARARPRGSVNHSTADLALCRQ